MTKNEKIKHYATAPRVYAGTITQIVDGNFRKFWVGKLRGNIVSMAGGEYKFDTKPEAIECAREFKNACIRDAEKLGIAI